MIARRIPVYILAAAAAMAFAGSARAGTSTPVTDACKVARSAPGDALISLPFEIVHGRVYIKARVNGQGPFTFAVDTGASGLGRADASLTESLGLPLAAKTETSDGVTVSSVDTVHLESLEVGGLMRTGLDLISRDYSGSAPAGAEISGIIGRDFFNDGLLVLDFPNRRLTFSHTASLTGAHDGTLAYERPFRIPVSIGDVTVQANLDTGASVALVLHQDIYDQVSDVPLEPAGRARLTNTSVETSRGIVPGPITIGRIETQEAEARVSERFPEAVIGGKILQAYVIAIDQRTQRVAICPGS
jgi:predicted aspartyl protease